MIPTAKLRFFTKYQIIKKHKTSHKICFIKKKLLSLHLIYRQMCLFFAKRRTQTNRKCKSLGLIIKFFNDGKYEFWG